MMQKLSAGTYLICTPDKFLLPKDFRKFTKTIVEYEYKLKHFVSWGISMNDDSNLSYAWFKTGKSEYVDQYGFHYFSDNFLVCVPIEMLTHIDIAHFEPIYCSENFNVDFINDIIFINHLQIRKT
jgi:hypothetical protein